MQSKVTEFGIDKSNMFPFWDVSVHTSYVPLTQRTQGYA